MYYNPNSQKIHDVKSKIYIAKYLRTAQDENFYQKKVYDNPEMFYFNVQPLKNESEIREFGQLSTAMKVAVITEKGKYLDKFNEFDVAYLDGVEPNGELENGDNANYRIYAVRNQNTIIRIYFLKLAVDNK